MPRSSPGGELGAGGIDSCITNVPDCVRVCEVLTPKESDVFTDHGTVP